MNGIVYAVSFIFLSIILRVESFYRDENSRPIIGVLVQETHRGLRKFGKTIIPASYVKMIEAAGGRVAPILTDQPKKYYVDMFNKMNGALFTGGWVSVMDSSYARSAKVLYDLAVRAFDQGDVFPIWGTCLGFEQLSYLMSGIDVLTECETWDMAAPLNFSEGYEDSKLFSEMSEDMRKDMSALPIAIHYHRHCVSVENFYKYNLSDYLTLLSINNDYNGTEFVSTMEAKNYPFFASQWHPEKILFEFVQEPYKLKMTNVPHSARAVEIAQWLSRFFINYARKSRHHFVSSDEENKHLIYNYRTTFSAMQCSMYEEVYIIQPLYLTPGVIGLIVVIVFLFLFLYSWLLRRKLLATFYNRFSRL